MGNVRICDMMSQWKEAKKCCTMQFRNNKYWSVGANSVLISILIGKCTDKELIMGLNVPKCQPLDIFGWKG